MDASVPPTDELTPELELPLPQAAAISATPINVTNARP
jgi:hypothetical protein